MVCWVFFFFKGAPLKGNSQLYPGLLISLKFVKSRLTCFFCADPVLTKQIIRGPTTKVLTKRIVMKQMLSSLSVNKHQSITDSANWETFMALWIYFFLIKRKAIWINSKACEATWKRRNIFWKSSAKVFSLLATAKNPCQAGHAPVSQ